MNRLKVNGNSDTVLEEIIFENIFRPILFDVFLLFLLKYFRDNFALWSTTSTVGKFLGALI